MRDLWLDTAIAGDSKPERSSTIFSLTHVPAPRVTYMSRLLPWPVVS